MIIKKFQGKSESEATEAAKKELGSGVVIMNVREVKKKGVFAFLKPKTVEVTVALEEEPDRAPTRSARTAGGAANKTAAGGNAGDGVMAGSAANGSGRIGTAAGSAGAPKGARTGAVAGRTASLLQKSETTDKVIEERLESLQSLLEKQLQKTDTEKEGEEARQAEAEEIPEDSNVRFLKLLYRTMLENEINEKYANQIIDELDAVLKPNMPIDFMLSNVYQKMILKFGQPAGLAAAKKGPKLVFFVGPTGVGKTTTIAKLASRYFVEEKKQVALFTTDTYRIAAAEQLRTYANILETPFRVIYSVDEMSRGIEEFKTYDYIFVDTAGHSHQNTAQREAMSEFIRAVDEKTEKEVYLVVSATTKYKDLISIAETYSEMTDYKLIFTKLDETTGLGNLLNLKLHTGAQISYVTYGQNVPDDMEDFNPQKTVKLLLGGSRTP